MSKTIVATIAEYLDSCSLTITFQQSVNNPDIYIVSILPKSKEQKKDLGNIPPLLIKGTIAELETAIPEALSRGVGFNREIITNLSSFEDGLKEAAKKTTKSETTTATKSTAKPATKEKPKGNQNDIPFDTDGDKKEDDDDDDDKTMNDDLAKETEEKLRKENEERAKKAQEANKKQEEKKKPVEKKPTLTKAQQSAVKRIDALVDRHNNKVPASDVDMLEFIKKEISKLIAENDLESMRDSYTKALVDRPNVVKPEVSTSTVQQTEALEPGVAEAVANVIQEDEEEDNPDESLQNEATEVEPPMEVVNPIDDPNEWL